MFSNGRLPSHQLIVLTFMPTLNAAGSANAVLVTAWVVLAPEVVVVSLLAPMAELQAAASIQRGPVTSQTTRELPSRAQSRTIALRRKPIKALEFSFLE